MCFYSMSNSFKAIQLRSFCRTWISEQNFNNRLVVEHVRLYRSRGVSFPIWGGPSLFLLTSFSISCQGNAESARKHQIQLDRIIIFALGHRYWNMFCSLTVLTWQRSWVSQQISHRTEHNENYLADTLETRDSDSCILSRLMARKERKVCGKVNERLTWQLLGRE